MTSANGGTFARQHPCDGWVDKLEPTLLTAIICFRTQRHNPKKTISELLQHKKLVFCTESRGNYLVSEFITDSSQYELSNYFLETDTGNQPVTI